MNKLQIKGTQSFRGIELPVIEGGFGEGKKCLSDKHISEIHNVPAREIRRIIKDNIKRFKEGVDYIDLQRVGDTHTLTKLGYAKQSITQAKNIYLLSERGYAKLIKIMDTDLAWELHDQLVDEYFSMREQLRKLTAEDMAWLELKKANMVESAQVLLNTQLNMFNQILATERDGEGKEIALKDIALSLSHNLGYEVTTTNITDYMVYKGYFIKQYFPKPYGKFEKVAHRQPTDKFISDIVGNGLAISKKPDPRGKVVYKFLNKFEGYFINNHIDEFVKFLGFNIQ